MCVHGTWSDENQGTCTCDACHTGFWCDKECDGNGKCIRNGTHMECDCYKEFVGE